MRSVVAISLFYLAAAAPQRFMQASTPTAWATSGGGWRAMAASFGFARAFQDASFLQDLDSVSCNSGSCWFLSLLAYDPGTYESVASSQSMRSFMTTLMNNEYTAADNPSQKYRRLDGRELAWVDKACKSLGSMLGSLGSSICQAASQHNYIWRALVRDLLYFGTKKKVDLHSVKADSASRAGLQGPALVFQTANATSGFIYEHLSDVTDDSSIKKSYILNKNGKYKYGPLPFAPLQWIVPSSNEAFNGQAAAWSVPPSSMYDYLGSYVGWADTWTPNSVSNWSNVQATTEMFGGVPFVDDIASASSAAAGFLGVPLLVKEILEYVGNSWLFNYFKDSLPGGGQALSVCDHNLSPYEDSLGNTSWYCPYPSHRLIDGGFVDNLATAQTVGYLQRRFGAKQRLRLVLTAHTQKPAGKEDGRGDISDLMQSSNSYSGKPGQIRKGKDNAAYYGVSRPSPEVFDCMFEKLSWQKVPNAVPKVAGSSDLRFAKVQAKTVSNDAFGVKGGTTVDLLIFALASSLGAFDMGKVAEHVDVAGTIAESDASKILKEWLRTTG